MMKDARFLGASRRGALYGARTQRGQHRAGGGLNGARGPPGHSGSKRPWYEVKNQIVANNFLDETQLWISERMKDTQMGKVWTPKTPGPLQP